MSTVSAEVRLSSANRLWSLYASLGVPLVDSRCPWCGHSYERGRFDLSTIENLAIEILDHGECGSPRQIWSDEVREAWDRLE